MEGSLLALIELGYPLVDTGPPFLNKSRPVLENRESGGVPI